MFGDLGKIFGATNTMGFSTALSLGDTLLSSYLGRKNTEHAHDLNQDAYSKRYQMTVNDMRRAGLNPILAATQGISGGVPGAVPSYAPSNIASTGTDVYRNSIEEQRVRSEMKDQLSKETQRNAQNLVYAAEEKLKNAQVKTEERQAILLKVKEWTETMSQTSMELGLSLTQEKIETERFIQKQKKFNALLSEKAYELLKGPLSGVKIMIDDPDYFVKWLIRSFLENVDVLTPMGRNLLKQYRNAMPKRSEPGGNYEWQMWED